MADELEPCPCGGEPVTVVVDGARLCRKCRDRWLIEETESGAIARELNEAEREIVLALSDKPQRPGSADRVRTIDRCPYNLFKKAWAGDGHRYSLTSFGMQVREMLVRHNPQRTSDHG